MTGTRKTGRPRKYPWDRWLGAPRTELVRGADYQCATATMAQALRNRASMCGLRLRLRYTDDGIVVEVRGANPERATA